MGFLSNMFSAAVKTVLTPVAVVKDVINIATDQEPDTTKNLLESAAEDVSDAANDLGDGEIL